MFGVGTFVDVYMVNCDLYIGTRPLFHWFLVQWNNSDSHFLLYGALETWIKLWKVNLMGLVSYRSINTVNVKTSANNVKVCTDHCLSLSVFLSFHVWLKIKLVCFSSWWYTLMCPKLADFTMLSAKEGWFPPVHVGSCVARKWWLEMGCYGEEDRDLKRKGEGQKKTADLSVLGVLSF